jgi:hypothetical protein
MAREKVTIVTTKLQSTVNIFAKPVPIIRVISKSIEVLTHRSRDSAVGIATGYGLDDRGVGVRVPEGSRILSSPHRPD